MESQQSVSKLSTESVGSRRELVANSVHTAAADATQINATRQLSRVGVGGVYWVYITNYPVAPSADKQARTVHDITGIVIIIIIIVIGGIVVSYDCACTLVVACCRDNDTKTLFEHASHRASCVQVQARVSDDDSGLSASKSPTL